MANLAEVIPSAINETVVVFGDSKTGKTTAVADLAHKHKLFWIDLERGATTLKKLPIEAQRNVTLVSIPDSPDNVIAMETILYLLKGKEAKLCIEHGKVNCPLCMKNKDALWDVVQLQKGYIVVIDSLTQLVQSMENRITAGKPVDYKWEFDDYRKIGQYMEMLLSIIQARSASVSLGQPIKL